MGGRKQDLNINENAAVWMLSFVIKRSAFIRHMARFRRYLGLSWTFTQGTYRCPDAWQHWDAHASRKTLMSVRSQRFWWWRHGVY